MQLAQWKGIPMHRLDPRGWKRPAWLTTTHLVIAAGLLILAFAVPPAFRELDRLRTERTKLIDDINSFVKAGYWATAENAVKEWLAPQWADDCHEEGAYLYRLNMLVYTWVREDSHERILNDLRDDLERWAVEHARRTNLPEIEVLATTAHSRIAKIEILLDELKDLAYNLDSDEVTTEQGRTRFEDLEARIENLVNE